MNFLQGAKRSAAYLKNHSDTALTIVACFGVGATVLTAIDDTKEAERRRIDIPIDATVGERAKEILPCYIPTAISSGLTVAAIIGSHKASVRKTAAAMALYTASEATLSGYQDKLREMFGEEKAEKFHKDISAKVAEEKQPARAHSAEHKEIYSTGFGNTLFYDKFTDRWFYNDIQYVRKVVNDVNHELTHGIEFELELNDFYRRLGLSPVEYGRMIGFNNDHLIDIYYPFMSITDDNNQPALILEFRRDGGPITFDGRPVL